MPHNFIAKGVPVYESVNTFHKELCQRANEIQSPPHLTYILYHRILKESRLAVFYIPLGSHNIRLYSMKGGVEWWQTELLPIKS